MKKVIVPQEHLDNLELARVRLYKLLEGDPKAKELHYGITEHMYTLSHTKYPELKYYIED